MPENPESKTPSDIRRIIELAYFISILLALFLAKEFLFPVVLAALIGFLLTPVVSRLERWGMHPVLAVLSVVAFAVALIGGVCAMLSVETLDLVNSIPKYRDNITSRWTSLQKAPPGPLNIAFRNIGDLISDLGKITEAGQKTEAPTKVQIVSGQDSALALAKRSLMPVTAPIGEFAVIIVLVVFMLLERKQFRVRFLRLIGHSHMVTTTLAVDEAGSRLSKFLLMQLAVNSVYALVLGVGLYFIGIPNAILWAVLTLVLRFVPYVGLWMSAFFPLVLSVAISTSWTPPILTLLLYVVLEVFTNNAVEPFVLGGSTGMSPLAVIVSALFWTWLWGPVGLLLAIPITSCLVTFGRYFPAFHPYSVLLAADPPTSTETKLLRLLTEGRLPEAKALIQGLTAMELSSKSAEELIVPVVRTIENELFPGASSNETKSHIYGQIREIIEELMVVTPHNLDESSDRVPEQRSGVAIVPLVGEGDEIVGRVLARLVEAEFISAQTLSWRSLRSEKIKQLQELEARYVFFSVVELRSAISVANMVRSMQSVLPKSIFMVGLWSLPPTGSVRLNRKIREAVQGRVYTNMEQAVRGIVALMPQIGEDPGSEMNASENAK